MNFETIVSQFLLSININVSEWNQFVVPIPEFKMFFLWMVGAFFFIALQQQLKVNSFRVKLSRNCVSVCMCCDITNRFAETHAQCECVYSRVFACSKANSNFQALTLFKYLHAIRVFLSVCVFQNVFEALFVFLSAQPPFNLPRSTTKIERERERECFAIR